MSGKTHKKYDYKLICLAVCVVVVIIGFTLFWQRGLANPQPQEFVQSPFASPSPQDEMANSIYDVKIEFIPQTASITCEACDWYKPCLVSFQIKNIGNKIVRLAVGDFGDNIHGVSGPNGTTYPTGGANGDNIIVAENGNQGAEAYLKPGETSTTLQAVIELNGNVPAGNRVIKIPLLLYGATKYIGESQYYFLVQTNVVHC